MNKMKLLLLVYGANLEQISTEPNTGAGFNSIAL